MSDTAAARHTLLKHGGRVREILATCARYGFASKVAAGVPEPFRVVAGEVADTTLVGFTEGERVRRMCTDLGPTFIKVGQILSTRRDVVGDEIADALTELQGNVPPDAPDAVRKTIESELDRSLDSAFADVDLAPIGSASIGQVHAARLVDGTDVVVKVQHVGAAAQVEIDLDIIEALAVLVEANDRDMALYRPVAIAAQLRRSLLAEVDYQLEAANLAQFRENFADEPDVVIPKPYAELTTTRVLTMSRIDGPTLTTTIDTLGSRAPDVMKRGAEIYIEMIFRDGLFHADPHPGNIVVLDDDRIGLLDFGKVGRIDDDLQDVIDDVVVAAAQQDLDGVTNCLISLCDPPPTLDRGALRADLANWLDVYGAVGASNVDVTGAAHAADDILRRHRLFMPADVSLLMRTLTQLQGLLVESGVDMQVRDVLEPYTAMIAAKRFAPRRLLRHTQRTAHDWERLADELPGEVTQILEGVRSGQLEVPLRLLRLDPNINRLVYAAIACSLFIGSSRLWAARVPPTIRDVSVPGAIGTMAAGYFAIRLLRAAKRAGGID